MKKCCRCKEEKDFSQFGRLKSSKDGYRHDCRLCRREFSMINRDKITEYKKSHYAINRDDILSKNREYYIKNKEKMDSYIREYWKDEDNSQRRSRNYQKWKKLNIDHVREYKRGYYKDVTMMDPLKRLKCSLRSSIRRFLKNKNESSESILGCSYGDFIVYIESRFESWMNWDNYGLYNGEENYGWDIDHIVPLSSAKNEEDIIKLNHYSNLQPLCSKVNRDIKNNRTDY